MNKSKKKPKLLPLSHFEWSSLSRYITYISLSAGLVELGSDQVSSLRLNQLSSDVMMRRKEKVLAALEGNMKKLERFVAEFRGQLSVEELSVVRSMYKQYRENIVTVRGHIGIIKDLQSMRMEDLFRQGGEDELPF